MSDDECERSEVVVCSALHPNVVVLFKGYLSMYSFHVEPISMFLPVPIL